MSWKGDMLGMVSIAEVIVVILNCVCSDPTLSMSRPRKGVLAQPFTTDECPSSPVFLNMDVAAFQDCPEVHMTSPTEPSLVASSMDVLHNSACRGEYAHTRTHYTTCLNYC